MILKVCLAAVGILLPGAAIVFAMCAAAKASEPQFAPPCPALPKPSSEDAVRVMRWYSYLKREVQP